MLPEYFGKEFFLVDVWLEWMNGEKKQKYDS